MSESTTVPFPPSIAFLAPSNTCVRTTDDAREAGCVLRSGPALFVAEEGAVDGLLQRGGATEEEGLELGGQRVRHATRGAPQDVGARARVQLLQPLLPHPLHVRRRPLVPALRDRVRKHQTCARAPPHPSAHPVPVELPACEGWLKGFGDEGLGPMGTGCSGHGGIQGMEAAARRKGGLGQHARNWRGLPNRPGQTQLNMA
eukprot:3327044-Rhodomonas_salina.2